MNIAIVGSGSMACLLGAAVCYANDVVLVGHWKTQLEVIASNGLTIIDPDGVQETVRLSTTSEPGSIASRCDVAIIAVKSGRTAQAAGDALTVLTNNGLGITLQNGLGNLQILQDTLGEARATAGVTSQGASLVGLGMVHHTGYGPTVLGLSPALGDRQVELVYTLNQMLRTAGWVSHVADDIDQIVWSKLAVSAAINPLTAILGVRNGELLDNPMTMSAMDAAALETVAVASAKGIALDAAAIIELVHQVARNTATNTSSMLQDIHRRVPTEIDAISGAVVQQAQALGLAAPVNGYLLRTVKQLENGDGSFDTADWITLLEMKIDESRLLRSGATV